MVIITMYNITIITAVLCVSFMIAKCEFVMDNYVPTCEYKLKNGLSVIVTRANYEVKLKNGTISFNLCSQLNDTVCGKNSGCVRNNKNQVQFSGKTFFPEGDNKLVLKSNDDNCTLSVKIDCSFQKEHPEGQQLGPCNYEVTLRGPSSDCLRTCGTYFSTQLIDLSPLKGKYIVSTSNRNFSIFLCDNNPDCGNEVSSCDITDKNNPIPLSSGNELVKYIEEENVIEISQKSTFKKKKYIFRMYIHCDWLANSPSVEYKQLLTQGKAYNFDMESNYGCIKVPLQCKFTYNSFVYDLNKAYNHHGFWQVANVSDSKILLNICGQLNLNNDEYVNNDCTKSHSQICLLKENKYINLGSIYKKPIVSNEKITLSIISGSRCENKTKYTTTIDFYCSKNEEGPRFVRSSVCEYFIVWNTPAACSEKYVKKCTKKDISDGDYQCIYEQKLPGYTEFYNLSGLFKPEGYVVKDKTHEIEYILNVCGPIKDPVADSLCKTENIAAVKYLDEYDLRKKIKQLGKVKTIYINEKYLVVKTSGGEFCEAMSMDYTSTIFFECSDKESDINLLRTDNCTWEFLWQSKYACPTKVQNGSNKLCILNHPLGPEYSINLSTLKKTSIKAEINGTKYLFDLCENSSECLENNCVKIPINKSLVTYGNQTYAEFSLNKKCDEKQSFNKTIFELVCDQITENDHFSYKELRGCVLIFQFRTHLACFKQDIVVPLIPKESSNKVEYKVNTVTKGKTHISRNVSIPPINYCFVKNHLSGYVFNISRLNLNVSHFKCPEITFNNELQIVNLYYYPHEICTNQYGKEAEFEFRITLKCKRQNLNNSTTSGQCFHNVTLELPEACQLLDSEILSNNNSSTTKIATIVSVVTVIVAIILGLGFWLYKIRRKNRSEYGSIMSYEKNADL